jgi:hypothetical protein
MRRAGPAAFGRSLNSVSSLFSLRKQVQKTPTPLIRIIPQPPLLHSPLILLQRPTRQPSPRILRLSRNTLSLRLNSRRSEAPHIHSGPRLRVPGIQPNTLRFGRLTTSCAIAAMYTPSTFFVQYPCTSGSPRRQPWGPAPQRRGKGLGAEFRRWSTHLSLR